MYHIEWYTTHEPNSGGSYEIFMVETNDEMIDEEGEGLEPGVYWWACFPGCLPDGDGYPSGPFSSAAAAKEDIND